MVTTRRRRASLKGWWRWLPALMVPFTIFFFETWLRTQTIKNGYEANGLDVAINEVRDRVLTLERHEAKLERMERINSKASALGLVEPEPGSIEVIRGEPSFEMPSRLVANASPPKPEVYRMAALPGRELIAQWVRRLIEPPVSP